jgi:single-strand DNA-binding protein
MGVNKVILVGNLGKDPEMRVTAQQMAICRFSLATGERIKKEGQWVDHTEWHNVVVFGKSAENCGRFLKKGSQVYIEGRIRLNKWQDKEGKDRYTTEILADSVNFIGSKRGDGSDMGYSGGDGPHESSSVLAGIPTADALPQAANGGGRGGPAPAAEPVGFDEDDIPF